jgi:hypothetical protein
MTQLQKCFVVLFLIAGLFYSAQAQTTTTSQLIQFSGVVVSSDSLQPIPYTSVIIRHANRGTITDYYGFYSFVAMKGDTIDFNYIGFKPASYVIADTLKDNRYSLIQVLKRDTIQLKEAMIYPWPSKEEFRRAFIELKLPDDDMKRAERNLELAKIKEVRNNVPYDAGMNYQHVMQEQQSRLYSSGQFPTYNLMNPLAWASFIKAWQDGAFKRKD